MVAVERLCRLINSTMALGALPIRWKMANIVVLPKTPRPASTPSKYSPINLLSAVAKVAEATVLHRLKAFVTQTMPCQSSN
jgi:hypothetical protein